jgi:hypothetical protein
MANGIGKYRRFQIKSEYFGKPAFIGNDNLGQAKCSIASKIRVLEQELKTEKNPIRRSAIRDVIESLKLLIK